jgi:hypothetical protein
VAHVRVHERELKQKLTKTSEAFTSEVFDYKVGDTLMALNPIQ